MADRLTQLQDCLDDVKATQAREQYDYADDLRRWRRRCLLLCDT